MTDFEQGGFLLINKPIDWSSFDVIKKVRNAIQKRYKIKWLKVGHAGTLDPLATGLLLICVGKYTKQISTLQGMEKEYEGAFFLGATTPSFDRETEVDREFDTSDITEEKIKESAKKFVGEIMQQPPVFSALKFGGKPMYEHARKGEKIEVAHRQVKIDAFEITEINLPFVKFKVVCSKGTYIRSLAHDFGKELNSGAYLYSLCRTRIGEYRLQDALDLEELVAHLNEGKELILNHARIQGT